MKRRRRDGIDAFGIGTSDLAIDGDRFIGAAANGGLDQPKLGELFDDLPVARREARCNGERRDRARKIALQEQSLPETDVKPHVVAAVRDGLAQLRHRVSKTALLEINDAKPERRIGEMRVELERGEIAALGRGERTRPVVERREQKPRRRLRRILFERNVLRGARLFEPRRSVKGAGEIVPERGFLRRQRDRGFQNAYRRSMWPFAQSVSPNRRNASCGAGCWSNILLSDELAARQPARAASISDAAGSSICIERPHGDVEPVSNDEG